MRNPISWRGALPFAVVALGVMVGLAFYVPAGLRLAVLAVAVVQACLIVAVGFVMSRRTLRAMERVVEVMRRLSDGETTVRLAPGHRDTQSFVNSFNAMIAQFQQRLTSVTQQRDELTAVLEHMADGVLIVDEMGRVKRMNNAAARLLGVTIPEAIGQSFAQVVRDHNLIEAEQVCRRQGVENSIGVDLNRLGVFLHATFAPMRRDEQSICLVILHNVTQLRHLETVRRDFVSNISHELRTPLASLKALVETLRDGALDDPPAAQRFLDRVEDEVDVMAQIVQELLDLSRTESGQAPLQLKSTPVADFIVPPARRLQPQAERARLTLNIELPDDLPPVLADCERLSQVVTNLVHNAIKFTPAEGTITVSAFADADEVTVFVRDTGIGIPADDLPRIFERFYKADRARSGGGTGLGLAIARHVIQDTVGASGRRAWKGSGSTFWFTLATAVVSGGASPVV
jgi:two-component system phosphate regulon sensor histidine kinase PhoR